ncbi:unnamed protein product [marine sediment metagenome]|uniref:Transposase IS4-like domain-containing protein n=1 Tax=marine sediment metagenome TaxID=412755 RepID=X0S6F9_9ZZZZ
MRQITLAHPPNKLEKQLLNLFHSSNLPLHFNKTGNKEFTNYQRISLIIIFRRENKSIRDFLEDLKESKWICWLGLKKIPKKSTFHDWLILFNMKLIRGLIDLSVDKNNLKVTAIDGSGVETNFKSSYYKKRLKDFGEKIKNSYHKIDILVDVYGKKQIIDYSFLLKNRHDSFVAKKILKKIKFKRCKILADRGYPNYDFIETAKRKQNNFVSPQKNYGERCRHDNFRRERKIRNYESNKPIYRRRVIVESVFSSLKRKQKLKLKSRLCYMKKREMGWHILFYNIRRNIVFDGKTIKESLSFYFFKVGIYLFPDKAEKRKSLKRK